MAMYRIFIEGKGNELAFLKNLIKSIAPNNTIPIAFITSGGWTKIGLLKNQFIENTDLGGINIVIFDADDNNKDPQNGGCELRREKLVNELNPCEYHLFLYPDNLSDGDFELLLEASINQDHKRLLDCFDNYENCLSTYKDANNHNFYNTPIRKSRIYSYIDAFKKSKKEKEKMKNGDWLFEKADIWNLNNNTLNRLRDFLIPFFNV